MYNVSFYKSIADTKSIKQISINDFLVSVKDGTYKTLVENIRNAGNKKTQTDLKKLLPNITTSGTFITRIDKDLQTHSELIQIDFDKDKNPFLNIVEDKAHLAKDVHSFAVFTSPTGAGLKVIVKIEPTQHKEIYKELEAYYKANYALNLDSTCSNISRAMFVSYDKDLHHNQESEIFILPVPIKKELLNNLKYNKSTVNTKQNEVELLIQKIESTSTDITQEYKAWLNIGFALASEFGPSGENYFHSISKFNAKYDFAACKEQYKRCCASKGTGININTLFALAKVSNVIVHEVSHTSKLKPKNDKAQLSPTDNKEIIFYSPVYKMQDGTQLLTDLKIDYVKFDQLIYSLGYRRFDMDSDFSFIRIEHNIITQVQPHQIQDHFLRYIDALPETIAAGIKREYLKTKIYKAPENYCSIKRLSLLKCGEVFFNEDTKCESFIYYKNGFVKCDKNGWSLQHYKNLKGCIWKTQIVDRDFKHINFNGFTINQMGVYAQFMFNVCNKNEHNFISLCSLTGYLLHSYTDTKLKAIILTDSGISEEANGRTGKTLFGNTLSHIKKLTQINGKDFDPTNKNKYQEANLDTQIIFLNDVRTNFKFENLYNDITEGVTVEKKNKNPFKVKAKMCITTNKTISMEGGSSKDRALEFEFSNHYSENYSPENEFKQRFFSDWQTNEWQLFDNFMMHCICVFLGNGIVEPKNKNLAARKLLDSTNKDFLEFMYDSLETKFIEPNKDFKKFDLHKKFITEYPEYEKDRHKGTPKTFYIWMKNFTKYDSRFKGQLLERKSNGERFARLEMAII